MVREGRDMGDRQNGSSCISGREFHRERERGSMQRSGLGLGLCSGVEELRTFSRFNDQDFPIRDNNDTASKFQWTYLLRESGNSMGDGVERGIQDGGQANNGRIYEGLVLNSMPGDRGRIKSVPTYGYNTDSAEYHGRTRNVTGLSVEEPDYHGRIRNVVNDLPNEGTEYHRRSRNVTGPWIESADYDGNSRNMTGLPVEEAEYHRQERSVMTSRPVEDDGRILVRDYKQCMDREISMKTFEDGSFLRFRNEDNSHSLTPRAHSSGQHTPLQGNPFLNMEGPLQGFFHHPADGFGISGNIPSSSCYSRHGIVYSKAGTNTCPISKKGSSYRRAEHNSSMGRHAEYIHSESQRSGKVYRRLLSEDVYDNNENVQGYNDQRDTFGNKTLNAALSRHACLSNSCNCGLEEDGLHSSAHALQQTTVVNIDGVRTAQEIEYGGVYLNSTDRFLEYQTEACYETVLHEEECPCEIDADGVSYEDQTWKYPISEEGTLTVDEDEQNILGSGDIDLHDQPKRMPKRKRGFVGQMIWPKRRTSTLDGRVSLSYDNGLLTADLENELVRFNRSCSHQFHSKETAGKSTTESILPFSGLSKELQSRLSKPFEPGSNDVKNRLKHPHFTPRLYKPQAAKLLRGNVNSCVKSSVNVNHIVSQYYGKAKRTSTKKRLKPAPFMDVCSSDLQVSHTGLGIESQQKLTAINSGSTREAGLFQGADPDHSILKVLPMEKDPPEKSEELNRQVNYWFLKCMLYLNTNPGRQKKFKEQGKSGTWKCVICSSSKEFIETKGVATHAFTSPKVGYRAAHLGFHRALCVLMGWDPAVASNGRWVCKSLPDLEAWALKEDIIVWPPLVIIHNGSARDFYNNEQVKISIEQLENILRDMGLSEGKTRICHGKPGNPNIMLVKFNGTLSGLKEAEGLHKVFSEKKHGRAELQEIDAGSGSNEGVSQKLKDKIELQKIYAGVECNEGVALKSENKIDLQEIDAVVGCNEEVAQNSEEKIQDALYGYLGIVEDFDKLSYDMRRHCVAKSKKEILACMDAAT